MVLDYQIARCTLEQAAQWCITAVLKPNPKLLVTINPEIIVQAADDSELKDALKQADLTVADGVGVIWAAKQFGYSLPERVPGIELMMRVLELGGPNLRVYFLGAKPGIAQRAANIAHERFGTVIAGVEHGYFKRPDDVPKITQNIAKSRAQVLLAGLGEGQELFLHQNRNTLNVPLMMGVGGALDVLSGEVKRTPTWTRELGLEWAYRVGLDRKRWHRFPRLLRFVYLVWQNKK